MIRTIIFASIIIVSMCGCGSSTTDKLQTTTDKETPVTSDSSDKNLTDIYFVKDGKKVNPQELFNKNPDEMNDKPDDSAATRTINKEQREQYLEEMIKSGDIWLEFTYQDSYLVSIRDNHTLSVNALKEGIRNPTVSIRPGLEESKNKKDVVVNITPRFSCYSGYKEPKIITISSREGGSTYDSDKDIVVIENINESGREYIRLQFRGLSTDKIKDIFKSGTRIRVSGKCWYAKYIIEEEFHITIQSPKFEVLNNVKKAEGLKEEEKTAQSEANAKKNSETSKVNNDIAKDNQRFNMTQKPLITKADMVRDSIYEEKKIYIQKLFGDSWPKLIKYPEPLKPVTIRGTKKEKLIPYYIGMRNRNINDLIEARASGKTLDSSLKSYILEYNEYLGLQDDDFRPLEKEPDFS
jgi:hypothetical protein